MGDERVTADEFDEPITIEFTKGKLLAYDVIDKSKPKIKPILTEDTDHPNRITLEPLLLNGHEWIDIQCVTDGDPGIPKVESRVAGETKSLVEMMRRATRKPLKVIALVVIISISAVVITSVLATDPLDDPLWMLPAVAFAGGFMLGSFRLLDEAEMREHRAWEKKQT
jgi:hypothetical protein